MSPEAEPTQAQRFGGVVERLAKAAGYDMVRGGKGRARLAEDTGMSVTAIGRTLRGETLPGLDKYQSIASALGVTPYDLLTEAGIIPREDHTNGAKRAVPSQNAPVSPETAADLLGVTNPTVRDMLITTMEQAQRLQRDLDRHGTGGEGAVARG